jgi:hypothetical protein
MIWRKLAQAGWAIGALAIVAISCGRTRDGTLEREIAGAGGAEDALLPAAGGVAGESGAGAASAGVPAAGQGGEGGGQPSLSLVDTAVLHLAAYCERAERCELEPDAQQVPGGCVAALLDGWEAELRETEQQIASS